MKSFFIPIEDIPEAEESEEYDHFSPIEEIYSASTLPVPTILEHCESSLSLTSTENLSSLSLLQESNSETGFSYDDSQEIQSLNTYSDTTIPGRMYVYTTYKEGRDLILRVLTDLRSNPLVYTPHSKREWPRLVRIIIAFWPSLSSFSRISTSGKTFTQRSSSLFLVRPTNTMKMEVFEKQL